MEKEEKIPKSKSSLQTSGIITLIMGLLSIAVSLFIYFQSKEKPELTVEQSNPITYASIKGLKNIGNVKLTLEGNEIPDLIALQVKIKNSGDVPISSIETSNSYNLVNPISLEMKNKNGKNDEIKILGIQEDVKIRNNFTIKLDSVANNITLIQINFKNLNVEEEFNFTLFLTGTNEPYFNIYENPLVGGNIILLSGISNIDTGTFWFSFKTKYFIEILGIIFISQFAVFLIWIVVQIRTFYKYEKSKNEDIPYDDPEKIAAEQEQDLKINSELNQKLISVPSNILDQMKTAAVPVSMGPFDKTVAHVSLFDLFFESYKAKWSMELKDKYPLPVRFDPFKVSSNYVFTSWYSWNEIVVKGVVMIGGLSLLVAVLGYAIIFL
jgi:hypothetical protein